MINSSKNIETINVGEASFELVETQEIILAGKIIYAKDFPNLDSFHNSIDSTTNEEKQSIFNMLIDTIHPVHDINLSANFWLNEKDRAFGFVREVKTESQPNGVNVYKIPPSLYIRAHTCKETAQLICKEKCEIWELFAYIRNFFMPSHNFKMAENGAQEMEVFDTLDHSSGYAYMPVSKI